MFYSKKYLFIQLWRYCLGFSRWKDCVWEYTWRKTGSCFPQEIARGTFGHLISSIYHGTPILFQFTSCPAAFLWKKKPKNLQRCAFSHMWDHSEWHRLNFKGVLFSLWLQKTARYFSSSACMKNLLAVSCHLVTVKQVDLFFIGENTTKGPFFCFISN
jgi:hypothetical protein